MPLNQHFMPDFARTFLSLKPAKAKFCICIRPSMLQLFFCMYYWRQKQQYIYSFSLYQHKV